MALHNTTDRYNYIYGNTVRKLEDTPEKSAVRERQPAKRDYEIKENSAQRKAASAQELRQKRQKQSAAEGDWKYSVVTAVAILICALSAIFYVNETVQLHNLSSQVSELKEEKSMLLNKQAALQSEIDKSINLDEISSYAEEKLDLVYPDTKHVIYYMDSTSDYFRQYESVNTNNE